MVGKRWGSKRHDFATMAADAMVSVIGPTPAAIDLPAVAVRDLDNALVRTNYARQHSAPNVRNMPQAGEGDIEA